MHSPAASKVRSSIGWVLALVVVGSAGYSTVVQLRASTGFLPAMSLVAWGMYPVAFAVTALMIVTRQHRNIIGWLLMLPAIESVISDLVGKYLGGIARAPLHLGTWLLAALAFDNFSWLFLIFPVFHLLLVFPNGKLVSHKWRWIAALELGMIVTLILLVTFASSIGPVDQSWAASNPIGFLPSGITAGVFVPIWSVGLVVITLSGIAALVVRYRRADQVEKHQIKWLLYAVSMFGLVYSISALFSGFTDGSIFNFVLPLSMINIAVAIAFAVLRYRLFDIDRVVSRTVGYAIVVGLLGALYSVGAVWLPSRLTGDSPFFVATSTLAVAALFNPVRRRVLRSVDRRFYRSRYDADHVAEGFTNRLRDQLHIEELTEDLVAVVNDTMKPASIGTWVREP